MEIRPASLDDAPTLTEIEREAEQLLIRWFGAIAWPEPDAGQDRLSSDGFIFIATDSSPPYTPMGFVHVLTGFGDAHLEQVSVRPRYGRQGIGRALVEHAAAEARRCGYVRLTLRTFRSVPWNGLFYASCGFVETVPDSPFLHSLVEVERALGLDVYDERIQMTLDVG